MAKIFSVYMTPQTVKGLKSPNLRGVGDTIPKALHCFFFYDSEVGSDRLETKFYSIRAPKPPSDVARTRGTAAPLPWLTGGAGVSLTLLGSIHGQHAHAM